MERWVVFAFISMVFAGFTSVIAKLGLAGISGNLGLTVRTMFVMVFVAIFAAFTVPAAEFRSLSASNLLWLGLSALATALSWVFYYWALKSGDVATVALIDKGSVVVAILLAALFLKEQITLQVLVGATLIVSGILIIANK